MSQLTFILIDDSEKRVLSKVDISTLELIVGVLSRSPATITEFESFYQESAGEPLYNKGRPLSSTLINILKRDSGKSEDEVLKKLERADLGKASNYESFEPDEKTPYDIPEAVGKGLNLRDALRDIDAGILVVDLRSRGVRYLSEAFDITSGPGTYSLPAGWKIISYSLGLNESEG